MTPLGLCRRTGFDKGYEIVMEKPEIVRNYLSGWFLIDFIATVDWNGFGEMLASDPATNPSWVKKLAMLKIFRLLRMGRLIDNLTKTFTVHSGFIEAGKFFVYTFVVGNLLACFFFLTPMLVNEQVVAACSFDEEANEAARECITFGSKSPDPDDPDGPDVWLNCEEDDFPTSGVGWYYKDSCMQGSWREGQGHEEICLSGVCGAKTYDFKPPDDITACSNAMCDGKKGRTIPIADFDAAAHHKWIWAFDEDGFEAYDQLTVCPDGTERAGLEPEFLDENQTTTVLLECLETANEGYHPSTPQYTKCQKCRGPWRLFYDSFYWSLTTMTTIGYGDRGPSTELELVYTLFAEVFGLAFFALLLTQINNVNDLLGMEAKKFKRYKDGVLQFMASRQLSEELIEEAVRFLNFRKSSFSGNAYDDEDERFSELSVGMRAKIRCSVYLPPLKRISLFGWDAATDIEEAGVKRFFDNVDVSNDGRLDKEEIGVLFDRLDIKLSKEQFDLCYSELDRNDTGSVDFVEFSWWWFKTKYGVPRVSSGNKAPLPFLDALASCLTPRPFGPKDRLVDPRDYGQNFVIILSGKVRILRPGTIPGYPGSSPDDPDRKTDRDRFAEHDDREPMFGFMACLTKLQFDHVRNRTDYWAVDAEEYTDTLWCTRKDFYRCFQENWLKGRTDMVEMAYYHYEVGNIVKAASALNTDGDDIVSHNEFLEGSSKIPHGFATHHQKDNTKKTEGALDIERLKAQEAEDEQNTELEMLEDDEILKQKVRAMEGICANLRRDVSELSAGMKAVIKHQGVPQGWEEPNPAAQKALERTTTGVLKGVTLDTLDLSALGKSELILLANALAVHPKAEDHMTKKRLNKLICTKLLEGERNDDT